MCDEGDDRAPLCVAWGALPLASWMASRRASRGLLGLCACGDETDGECRRTRERWSGAKRYGYMLKRRSTVCELPQMGRALVEARLEWPVTGSTRFSHLCRSLRSSMPSTASAWSCVKTTPSMRLTASSGKNVSTASRKLLPQSIRMMWNASGPSPPLAVSRFSFSISCAFLRILSRMEGLRRRFLLREFRLASRHTRQGRPSIGSVRQRNHGTPVEGPEPSMTTSLRLGTNPHSSVSAMSRQPSSASPPYPSPTLVYELPVNDMIDLWGGHRWQHCQQPQLSAERTYC
mmetsp:Transcript_206/g.528  ORF Transcript_206/g.528 Transcript_206/m.528 type:complete len:289 (+) Transcript_206:694-1560(+)